MVFGTVNFFAVMPSFLQEAKAATGTAIESPT
jgi:hypothetical protein